MEGFPYPGLIVRRTENRAHAEDPIPEQVTGVMVSRGRLEFARDLFYSLLLGAEASTDGERVVMRHGPVLATDEEFVLHVSRKSYAEEDTGAEKIMYRAQLWYPEKRVPVELAPA